MMRTMTLALVMTGMIILGGCDKATDAAPKGEIPRNVRVLELDPETVDEFFEISGPVAPVRGTDLSSQESGPVVAIPVGKGEAVSQGGIVLELERGILKAELDAADAALALEAYNVDKVRQLYEAGKVSRIELLTAQSNNAQAASRRDVLQERYDRAGIQAPFDGVVVDRYVELGQLVMPGQKVARILDPYTLKLEAYLTDAQVPWVQAGDKARVKVGQAGELADGTVSWVGFEADRMTGKFKVEIEISNPDLKFNSGVIGRARLDKNLVTDVVAIPRDAVIPGRAGPTAFVVEGDRAHLRRLELGTDQGVMVVVRDGLLPGDMLVVRGHRDLRDGSLVTITETATAADGSMADDPGLIKNDGTKSRLQDEDGATLGNGTSEASR